MEEIFNIKLSRAALKHLKKVPDYGEQQKVGGNYKIIFTNFIAQRTL
jgi:hypothetical protein